MTRQLVRGAFVWLLVVTGGTPTAFAGKLDDFERSSTNPGKDDNDHDRADVYYDDDSGGDAAALGILILATLPIYGGLRSLERVRSADTEADKKGTALARRRAGEALLSFVRVDVAYQLVESDVDAVDVRAELGYGPLAAQVRETHYDEDEPNDHLDLVQAHALWRMTVIEQLEIDFGIGGVVIDGENTGSGVSGTVPVLIHPWDFLGLEFRPSWGSVSDNTIEDYDLSLLAGWRFVSVRAGYRWTESGGSSLNGPIFGLAARW